MSNIRGKIIATISVLFLFIGLAALSWPLGKIAVTSLALSGFIIWTLIIWD